MDEAAYLDFLGSVKPVATAKVDLDVPAPPEDEDEDTEAALEELEEQATDDLTERHNDEDSDLEDQHDSENSALEARHEKERNELYRSFNQAREMLLDKGESLAAVKEWLAAQGGGVGARGSAARSKKRNRVLWLVRLLQMAVDEKDSGDWPDLVLRARDYGASAVERPQLDELAGLAGVTVRELFTEVGMEEK